MVTLTASACTRRQGSLTWLLAATLLGLLVSSRSVAQETGDGSSSKATANPESKSPTQDDFDVTNEDWGSYYDPQNIFCGNFDCYKILGFDYEEWDAQAPTKTQITKRYRALSREWHPDKSKHKHAKRKFVKIARAYEVLTNKETRKEYDLMRYNPDAYFNKYGSSVLWTYAPKSDTTIVLIVFFLAGNLVSWMIQKHRWQLVADRLVKAAVEDWAPSQGGTAESKHLRDEAHAILVQRGSNDETNNSPEPLSAAKRKAGKKAQKVSGKEKKRLENEALSPIVKDLVYRIDDFGAGFHKPTWNDLLVVTMCKLPFKLLAGTVWEAKYWMNRLRNKPLSDEEKSVLTSRAVGPVTWKTATQEERAALVVRELWKMENLVEFQEEQEIKKLSAADQKHYFKLKKKGKLDKVE